MAEGHRGFSYDIDFVEAALEFLYGPELPSYARVAEVFGVSHQTVWNWDHSDMSETAVVERTDNKGWNCLLSDLECLILWGSVVYHSVFRRPTTLNSISTFGWDEFGVDIGDHWIREHLREAGFSLHLVKQSVLAETDPSLFDEAVEQHVRIAESYEPTRLYSVDISRHYDQPKSPTEVGLIGGGVVRRYVGSWHGFGDQVLSMLRDDGSTAFVILTKRQDADESMITSSNGYLIKRPVGKVRGEKSGNILKSYQILTRCGFLQIHSTLLTDGDASQNTNDIKHFLESKDIILEKLKPGLAKFTNPNDSNFNSYYVRNVRSIVAEEGMSKPLTTREKLRILCEAHDRVDPITVRNQFKFTGYLGSKSTSEETMARLLSQGLHPREAGIELHSRQLNAYLDYHLEYYPDDIIPQFPLGDRITGPFFDIINNYRHRQLNF